MKVVCYKDFGNLTIGKAYNVIVIMPIIGENKYMVIDDLGKVRSLANNFWDYFMNVYDWRDILIDLLVD